MTKPDTEWICDDRRESVIATIERLKATVEARHALPQHGVLIWFDREEDIEADSDDWDRKRVRDARQWRGLFHQAWAIGHTTIPGKISDRLASKGFDSAIWVGQSALDGSPERLTRLAAHEIRHAAQYAFDPQLHYAGQGLARALVQLAVERHLPVPIYSNIPIESDAEAWARDLTVSLYGEE